MSRHFTIVLGIVQICFSVELTPCTLLTLPPRRPGPQMSSAGAAPGQQAARPPASSLGGNGRPTSPLSSPPATPGTLTPSLSRHSRGLVAPVGRISEDWSFHPPGVFPNDSPFGRSTAAGVYGAGGTGTGTSYGGGFVSPTPSSRVLMATISSVSSTGGGAASAAVAAIGGLQPSASQALPRSESQRDRTAPVRHLGQVLTSMVDADHMVDEQRDHGPYSRTTAEMIPELGGSGLARSGSAGEPDADAEADGEWLVGGTTTDGGEAGSTTVDRSVRGDPYVRSVVRSVSTLGGSLLSPTGGGGKGQAGVTSVGGGGAAPTGGGAAGAAAPSIPVLNDFIEVAAGPYGGGQGPGGGGADGRQMDPTARRRAVAEAAARAREEERTK